MSAKLILFVSYFLIVESVFSRDMYRGGAELLNPKAYEINVRGSLFQTASHYDDNGVEQQLLEGSSFRLMDLDLGLSYGYSREIEIRGMGRARKVDSYQSGDNRTQSGFQSLGGEIKYGFITPGKLSYAIGAQYRYALNSNTTYNTQNEIPLGELSLGDSGSEYGANFYLSFKNAPTHLDFKLGYLRPGEDLSDEVVYEAKGRYLLSSLSLFAGGRGVSSLKNDNFGDNPSAKPLIARGNTRLFNSINREYKKVFVGGQYQFDSFLAVFEFEKVLSGISTDKGDSWSINLIYSTPGVTKESIKVNEFKEYLVDGAVLKISGEGNFVKIDQGLSNDVEKGMKFDLYQTDYFGGNVLVASGYVYELGAVWSVIKITKRYQKIEIRPGFAARGYED